MKKTNINDITLDSETVISTKILAHKDFTPFDEEIIQVNKKSKKNKVFVIIALVAILAILFFYIGHTFSSAVVSIQKTRVPFEFSSTAITANQSDSGTLPFTVVEVTDTHHESVMPDMINSSPKKATGSVIIYNSYSKTKINLKKGSVLIANNNIRFLTDQAVVIPGYTTDANKQILPGQVIVKITAEKQGSAANIGNADLILNSYQKQKAKIYARTNEIISGGADQMAYGLSDTLKKSISEKIDDALRRSLFIKASAEIPSDYLLYPDMIIYNPKSLVIAGTPQTLDVSKEASLIAYVLKRQDVQQIIQNKLSNQMPINPQFLGIEDLSFKLISTPNNLLDPQTLELSLTGKGQVVPYVNTTELAKQLSSLKIKDAKKLLSSIQSLQSYDISVKPTFVWLMPKNSKHIKVIDVNNN